METYSFLRALADSWILLAMTALFLGVIVYSFRPRAKPLQDEAAMAIFRNDQRPASAPIRRTPNQKEA